MSFIVPIVIDREIPAYTTSTEERIFVIDRQRAAAQKTRPLEIAILDLIPTEEASEARFIRLLSNSPVPVNITLLKSSAYPVQVKTSKIYKEFSEIKHRKFDGMIITGTPFENTTSGKMKYWSEIKEIFDWTKTNVNCTLFSCWAAQTALNYFYNIKKHPLKKNCFGIFTHNRVLDGVAEPLMRGISDEFNMPHSRHNIVYAKDILHIKELKILSYSKRAGASIIKSVDNRRVFLTGHLEYDRYTLKNQFEQNCSDLKPPVNYFSDKEKTEVNMSWASSANLFYINWLNYYVYQAEAA